MTLFRFYGPLVIATLAVMLWTPSTAQQKYEREYTLKPAAVPAEASAFIAGMFKDVKIHWYGEQSLNGKSVEAKFKASGKTYSIEFDDKGKLQDIELLIKFKDIPEPARNMISENLKKKFSKFNVVKTQRQWTGTTDALKEALTDEKLPGSVTTRYELILKAKLNKITKYYEVLCKNNGAIESVHEIVERNADNLIY